MSWRLRRSWPFSRNAVWPHSSLAALSRAVSVIPGRKTLQPAVSLMICAPWLAGLSFLAHAGLSHGAARLHRRRLRTGWKDAVMVLPADGHVHTEWSWDAPNGSMERTCARAVKYAFPPWRLPSTRLYDLEGDRQPPAPRP